MGDGMEGGRDIREMRNNREEDGALLGGSVCSARCARVITDTAAKTSDKDPGNHNSNHTTDHQEHRK